MSFIIKHVQPVLQWFKHVVTQPREELNRWQGMVRYSHELGIYGWKALQRDNAPQMAAALSFRTLFALLPVLVVSTVVVRAVQGTEKFQELVSKILQTANLYELKLGHTTGESVGSLLEGLVKSAAGLNLATLGWIGLAVVMYSAISLLVTIENSFNAIYGAPQGRSWVRRIPTYWLLLTMSPVFIGITIFLDNRFGEFINNVQAWKWLLTFAKVAWGFCVIWLFMFAMYRLVPNTKVTSRAAMIGGFISALFLAVGKGSLGAYFKHAVSLESLYGQLGLIPLVMFWMYLMWLVILFGLEVSATIQGLAGRQLEELEDKRPQNGLVDPASVLNIMEIITERFGDGLLTTARQIADETLIQESMVCRILDRLVERGILHKVEGQEEGVTLARPPEQINGDALLEIGYALVDEGGVGRQSPLIQRLRDAQRKLAGQATLASLLTAKPAIIASDQGSGR